ncbi:MAG: type II secretion system secretin GspD [Bdellovibrionota bacterium]
MKQVFRWLVCSALVVGQSFPPSLYAQPDPGTEDESISQPQEESSSSSSSSSTSSDERIRVDEKGKIHLDFVNAEIVDVATSISELTKKNFIIDDKVKGKITIISPKSVSVQEAYQAFISALEVKNFTVVPAGKMLKIIPLRDMKTQPLPIDNQYPMGGADAFVTRLLPIKFISASEISKSLRSLISRNGDMISYNPTNTLIITDNLSNIRKVLQIVEKLDQKGFQESVNIIKLRFAPATETANKVKTLFDLDGQANPQVANNGNGQPGGAASEGQSISKVIPDERTNSLIIVSNTVGFKKVEEFVSKIDQSLEDQIGTGKIHVHYLEYADATELAQTLSGVSNQAQSQNNNPRAANRVVAQPATGSDGTIVGDVSITADTHTNSLIITASASDYEAMVPVLNRLDIRRPQAFVEAMIMEIDIDKAYELGLVANAAGAQGNTTAFGATQFGTTSSLFLPSDPTALSGLTLGLRGKNFSLPVAGGSINIPVFGGTFRALQTDGVVNVLSTPNILTQDNKEAEIVVGRVVPFLISQGFDATGRQINQIQRENVAITLRVTPQINSSDEMTLDIYQEIQDLVAGADFATLGPTTSKRSAKTTVLVKDGQTVTVGGLINDKITESNNKVPVLGDMPLIGWLFRKRNKEKTKTSLYMMITPHIIRDPADLEKVTIEKNEQRKDFIKANKAFEHPGINAYDLNHSLKAKEPAVSVPVDSPTGGFLSDESGSN